jgi:hypothetical protein
MLDRCRQGDACEGNVVSQQVGHDRPAAAVWNVIECRQQPRLAQKLLDHEGAERGLPRRAHVQRRRLRLGELHQLGERGHPQSRIGHDDEAFAPDHGDVGEIRERVIAEICGGGGREYVRPISADHQGVAVRIRARDLDRADHAAAAGLGSPRRTAA